MRRGWSTMNISILSESDEDKAVSTILLAFATDSGARWFSPRADTFLHNMSAYARLTTRTAISHKSAFCTENCNGVAVCLPPGVELDGDKLANILKPGFSSSDAKDMEELAKQIHQYRPQEQHWYLPIIGVDPAHQLQGLGGKLMTHICKHFDLQGKPAYLEATNPRNTSLYLRHGFEVLVTLQVGASPTITPMLRQPR